MSWDKFKSYGIYKFKLDRYLIGFQDQIEKGKPFPTASGKIEILSSELAKISDWKKTQYGSHIPSIPKWIDPWVTANYSVDAKHEFHMITPHPRQRTHSIYNNLQTLRETCEQEVTINPLDAKRLGIKSGETVEVWNERGRIVLPTYLSERCRPGVLIVYEGTWLDLDEDGVDRGGNPNILCADVPSPAGAFAYNSIRVSMKKTTLQHRSGWDGITTSKSHIFKRDG